MRSDNMHTKFGRTLVVAVALCAASGVAQADKPKPEAPLDEARAAELPPEAAIALLDLAGGTSLPSTVSTPGAWKECQEQADGMYFPASQVATLFGTTVDPAALRPWDDIEVQGMGAFGNEVVLAQSRTGKNKLCSVTGWNRTKRKNLERLQSRQPQPAVAEALSREPDAEWFVTMGTTGRWMAPEEARDELTRVITALHSLGAEIKRNLIDD